jgi:alpha-L-fucosidase
LPNNQLICAFFAGQYEKAPDVGIWGANLTLDTDPSEVSWTTPRILIKIPNRSMGNPVWYLTPSGKLYLFFQVLHHGRIFPPGWSDASILYTTSSDFGNSWSDPEFLRKMWFWIIRCAMITPQTNKPILPVHREILQYQSMMYINDNLELTGKWKRFGRLKTPKGCLEPSITEFPDGELLCSLRTKDHKIFFSRSLDHGHHWTLPEASEFPNPNSQTCLYVLQSGRCILIFNNATSGRSPLSISYSMDKGKTWSTPKDIENENGKEFSYPSVVQDQDGIIHLTYTHYRTTIRYCRFDESWLLE